MTRQTSFITRAQRIARGAAGGALVLAALAAATTLRAQQPTDAKWQPFVGCWTPDASSTVIGANATSRASMVCVVPVANSASVDIATINGNIVQHTERVTATGTQINRTIDNCPGWESATWSADGNRVFLNSNFACGNGVQVKGSGVLALSPEGQFIQVQGTNVNGNAGARVVRYNLASVMLADGSSLADSAMVNTVPAQAGFALQAVRAAAGNAPSANDILDLSKHVDAQVAQAWVTEFGFDTKLSAKELVKLADAGLPTALSDLMVAMQYPENFKLQRAPSASTNEPRPDDGGLRASSRCDYYMDGFMSPYDAYNCFGRYGYGYSPYGYSPFGYLSSGRYGYGNYGYPYGNNFGNYYYGSQPIIIVRNGNDIPAEPRGRAVSGGGYTRSTGTTSTTPRTTAGSTSSGSSSSGSTSTSAGAGSGGDGGSSSTGRTAKPRTPPPSN